MDLVRLDRLLIDRGIVASRPRAERLIAEHGVLVNGALVHKPGKKVPADAQLEPQGEDLPWVSRGALKLIAALDAFSLDLHDRVVLDLGASTGGFTEVCLHGGARQIHAVDVGSDQLAPHLKEDPRVRNIQQMHVKHLTSEHLQPPPDTIVIDLSFISLEHVWPRMSGWLGPEGFGVALIKPQFEVGPEHLGRSGVVRDDRIRAKAVARCCSSAANHGFSCSTPMDSPIEGGSGNREFLLHFTWGHSA